MKIYVTGIAAVVFFAIAFTGLLFNQPGLILLFGFLSGGMTAIFNTIRRINGPKKDNFLNWLTKDDSSLD